MDKRDCDGIMGAIAGVVFVRHEMVFVQFVIARVAVRKRYTLVPSRTWGFDTEWYCWF